MRFACAVLALGVAIGARSNAQAPARDLPAAMGLFNWIHSTADSERAFPFYRDVLGIELTRSPFAGPAPAGAPPVRIEPVSNAAPDPLIWDLTDTKGSRFRNVFMRAPNTPFGLELSEFFDVPRSSRQANAWDPGASLLIVTVRNLDAVLARARAAGAPVVTVGGAPVTTPAGRAVLIRDPDGYLVQLVQASPAALASASPGEIVATSIGITVADPAAALRFYRDLLGFEVRGTRQAAEAELRLHGLTAGTLTHTSTAIPGTTISVVFSQFTLPPGVTSAPFAWRIPDVGSPQFQLQVRNLDALLERTRAAGYRFLSVGGRPIIRPFGRFVFAVDPDGVLVEYVERSASTR